MYVVSGCDVSVSAIALNQCMLGGAEAELGAGKAITQPEKLTVHLSIDDLSDFKHLLIVLPHRGAPKLQLVYMSDISSLLSHAL